MINTQKASPDSISSEDTVQPFHKDPVSGSFPEMETMIRNMSICEKPSQAHVTLCSSQDPKALSFMSSQDVNPKEVPINRMGPREQEEADEWIRKGTRYLFDNEFMKAKSIFQSKVNCDPLYANGLGIMTFMKAILTDNEDDIQLAMGTLMTSITIANCQINGKGLKTPNRITCYLSSLVTSNQTGLPLNPSYKKKTQDVESEFISSGVLRAYVIKAESCLLMGALQLMRENVLGLVKCTSNLQKGKSSDIQANVFQHQNKAYSYYTAVWQEYKRMGQNFTKHMDRDTVSAMQFGIGTLHLLVSSFPPKLANVFSLIGFKSYQQLGFALLKLCIEAKSIKSPFASLVLLFYYFMLCDLAPQIYSEEFLEPALDCLNEAQRQHPNSVLFLYCAGLLARLTKNLSLSTRSFQRSRELCLEEWMGEPIEESVAFEVSINHAMELHWTLAQDTIKSLHTAFSRYFIGACQSMCGQQTESILTLASVPNQPCHSELDFYAVQRVASFEKKGYQHTEFCLPGLELLLIWNAFEQMEQGALEACLTAVQGKLEIIYEREKAEYTVRWTDIAPDLALPDYYDERTMLLLIKASLLNALKRFTKSIAHINWIMDHLEHLKETWVVPFIYWEAGVTSWGLGDYRKSRRLWETAMSFTRHVFEYRMMRRLSLALRKCDEIGILSAEHKPKEAGLTSNGKRRMPVVR